MPIISSAYTVDSVPQSDRGNRVLSFSAQYTGTLDDSTSFTGNIVAEGVFNVFRVLGQVDA